MNHLQRPVKIYLHKSGIQNPAWHLLWPAQFSWSACNTNLLRNASGHVRKHQCGRIVIGGLHNSVFRRQMCRGREFIRFFIDTTVLQ